MSQRQRRLKKLWRENPLCHWCKKETVLKPKKDSRGRTFDNVATIDHLRNRLDPDRLEPNHAGEPRTVLACCKCNMERGRKRVLEEYHGLENNNTDQPTNSYSEAEGAD